MSGLDQVGTAPERDMFDQLVDDWHQHLKINTARTTIATYLRHAGYFGDYLRKEGITRDPSEHTHKTINDYMVYLRERPNQRTGKPLKGTYRLSQYRSLEQYYKWLKTEGEIDEDPFDKTTVPEGAVLPLVPLVPDDVLGALVEVCEGNTFERRRDLAIIRMLFDCGPRSAELASLHTEGEMGKQPGLVPARNCAWILGKGTRKTGPRWRLIPYGNKTSVALRRYLRRRSQHPWAKDGGTELWLGKKGPLTPSGIDQMIDRRCTEAGIPPINQHKFRHTWANNLRESGEIGDAEMMALGGWNTMEMLVRYGQTGTQERAINAAHRAARGDRI